MEPYYYDQRQLIIDSWYDVTEEACKAECISYDKCRYVVFFPEDNDIDNINQKTCVFYTTYEPSTSVFRYKNAILLTKQSNYFIFIKFVFCFDKFLNFNL